MCPYARVREGIFALDGLLGLRSKSAYRDIVGTGRIGPLFPRIMAGFGCTILAFDPRRNADCEVVGVRYVPFDELLCNSDIISLHCPLTPATRPLIGSSAVALMREGAMLINISRGGVVDTRAVIDALKTGSIGSLGLDGYEEEADPFWRISRTRFARLLSFPNVLVTSGVLHDGGHVLV